MNNETRRINTGMYTNIAWDLMHLACSSIPILGNIHVARDKEDGQVYLRVWAAKTWKFYPTGKSHPNVFFGKSQAEVLSAIADKLKSLVETAASIRKWPSGWWNGKSERKYCKSYDPNYYGCESVTITVGDAFRAFSFLKGLPTHADSRVVGRPLTESDFERLKKAKDAAKAEANARVRKEIAEWDKTRLLHTGLYSDDAYNLLHKCIHASLCCLPEKIRSFNDFCKVKRAEDKEILLDIRLREYSIHKYENTRRARNPFYGKTDAEALRTVGDFIRLAIVKCTEDELGRRVGRSWWSASNGKMAFAWAGIPVGFHDIKVSKAYQIVSFLKGAAALPEEEAKESKDAKAREDAVEEISLQYRRAADDLRFKLMMEAEAEIDALRRKFESRVRAVDPSAELNLQVGR